MQNLLNDLKDLLQQDERLVIDGKLLKNKIIELGLQLDPSLLKMLLSQPSIKKYFFQEVEKVLVFDKIKFQKFVSNKTFLPDSYTTYKNKIGLIGDNEFISESKEVVLSFPYKDCVLEGGQTKEVSKRTEIFWNETLAPDEINRLFQPKVFSKVIKYKKEKTTDEVKFNQTDNLIIKGNNLLALHSLKQQFTGKIKLIYIDPPYNTGTDSFGYNDSFNHSSWLTFMKNRLEVAYDLLQPEGVIFVHIGDEEMHYLKVLMDEIFKRDFFIGTIPRKTRTGKSDVPFKFSQDFDWILVYTKKATPQTSVFKRSIERKYYKSADFPNDEWRLNPITTQRTIKERPNSDYTMVNPKNREEYPVNPNRSWAVTKDTFTKYYKEHKIIFPGDYDFFNIGQPMLRVFKSEEISNKGEDFDKTFFSSDTININIDVLLKNAKNKNGTDEIVALFGDKAFSYPKNELLLKTIIESCTKEGDIVLDYHLGSGTTAAVAHKMKRQYIGIEQMDYIEDITVERLKMVINGDNNGVSKEVGWKGGGSFIYMELHNTNKQLMKLIEKGTKDDDLLSAFDIILKDAKCLTAKGVSEGIIKSKEEFKALSIPEKRKILYSLLDKNFIYLPVSEINDADYQIDNKTKQFNQTFYKQQ